jgi:NAD(P)-dependent dehydrogenase (short-subunit alcohol dehydrogenase family)
MAGAVSRRATADRNLDAPRARSIGANLKIPGPPIPVDPGTTIDLDGRHVMVTGASRGIGAAVAAQLARAGARVSLVSRTYAAVQAAKLTLPRVDQHAAFETDLTDVRAVQALLPEATRKLGPLYALVNNVGGADAMAFVETDAAHWRHMIDVNLMSAVFCAQAALPAMLERREGRIVNMASTASLRGYRHVSAYTAGKHALLGFTRALAIEVEKEGITVNAVCPGYVNTERIAESLRAAAGRTGLSETAVRERFAASNTSGVLVDPVDVARVVAWLLGPGAAHVTGRHIVVDGRPLEASA